MPKSDEPQQLDPFAAILAWIVPGLGHLAIGERRRGLILMVAIHLMIIVGLLIGGISVVDRVDARLWYLGQVLAGPVPVLVDRYHQSRKVEARDQRGAVVRIAPRPQSDPPYEPSLARVNELGTLFVTLAGMLNLMCIIDVAQHPRRDQRREQRQGGIVGTVEARNR